MSEESNAKQIPQHFESIRLATPGTTNDIRNPGALPPKDSWIELDPGTEFELNAKTQEEWLTKVQKFRRVRGNFLAACFDIEYTIDSIIGEVFFPKPRPESLEILKRLFDNIFLKTRSFGKKTTLLENLLKELPTLANLIPKELIPELKDIIRMRNGFAHFPIIFKPIQTNDQQTIAPLLAVKYPPVPLDQSFFKKYGKSIPKVASVLSKALQTLSKDELRDAPASETPQESIEGNSGPIYLGHSILNTDLEDWMLE